MAKQKQVEINGTTYTLQHPGARASVQMRDRSKDRNGLPNEEKYCNEIMKHVVVDPKVSWEYFEDVKPEDFEKVIVEATLFVSGGPAENTQ